MKKEKYPIFSVSDETIRKTIKCHKNLACLNNNDHPLCPVRYHFSETLVLLHCSSNKYCGYRMSFGNFFICTCPTRLEIYKKHQRDPRGEKENRDSLRED